MTTGAEEDAAGPRRCPPALLAALATAVLAAAVVTRASLPADSAERPQMDLYLEERGIRVEMTTSFAGERNLSRPSLHAAGVTTVAQMWPGGAGDHEGVSPVSLRVAAGSTVTLVGWVRPDCATSGSSTVAVTFSVVAVDHDRQDLVSFSALEPQTLARAASQWCDERRAERTV